MHNLFQLFALISLLIIISCSQGSDGSSSTPISTNTVSGKIFYELVPLKSQGLDYESTERRPVRNAKVEAQRTSDGAVLATGTTNDEGEYSLEIPSTESAIKIAALSQMDNPAVIIEDNTAGDALYVAVSEEYQVTGDTTLADLTADSGWSGTNNDGSYISERVAAPFAILDAIYEASKKVGTSQLEEPLPLLKVNWSKDNVPTLGEIELGQIGTSFYDGSELYILGKSDVDTDEYDLHVVVHEWAHYFEEKISRADSQGGPHTDGERLDMSVAFGEGWGNALSAMVLEPNIIYRDSNGINQQTIAVEFSLERSSDINPGWFSEISIQEILYDIYDFNSDANDNLALGIDPIINVLKDHQKTTPARTSIFSFINGLKGAFPERGNDIDQLVLSKEISPVQDDFGTGEIHNDGIPNLLPLYQVLEVDGAQARVTLGGGVDRSNEVYNNRYYRFTPASPRTRVTWTGTDTYLIDIYQQGKLIYEDSEISSGEVLGPKSATIETPLNKTFVIHVRTHPDYINDPLQPINFDLQLQSI